MTQKDRMDKGMLYMSDDDSIMEIQLLCLEKLYDFNKTRPGEMEKRNAMLKEMLGSIGKDCYIEPPFNANWGGKNVYFGDGVYANFNLTLVDDAPIYVGNRVKFGPGVIVATAGHPIEPSLRAKAYQFNREVRIGNNVWIGGGAVILPGITIGDNTVIGAGSIVTKDIPDNVVAVGNPCKVLRKISGKDKEFYYKDDKIDWENLKQT